jgi:hypothetical protein
MRERNRGHVYNIVIEEFERSGINQATLASRLGKAPEVISRWLGTPSNWTLDTFSDLLFAISGAELQYTVSYPLGQQSLNITEPMQFADHRGSLEAVPYFSDTGTVFMVSLNVLPLPAVSTR